MDDEEVSKEPFWLLSNVDSIFTVPSPSRPPIKSRRGPVGRKCLWGPDSKEGSCSETETSPSEIRRTPWHRLPTDVMVLIYLNLDLADIKSSRLVCKEWHFMISSRLSLLKPRNFRGRELAKAFPAIRYLDLKRCQKITDEDLNDLWRISSLVALSLENCYDITDESMEEVVRLQNLRSLSLKNCVKLTDDALRCLCGINNSTNKPWPKRSKSPMQRFNLRSESILPTSLALSHVEKLDLSGCLLLTDQGFQYASQGLVSLKELTIGGCSRVATINDAALLGIAKCTRLQALDLSGCSNITNAGFAHLTSLSHLRELNLWNCLRLNPSALNILTALPSLSELCLRGCQPMDDTSMIYIAKVPALCKLDLRACENLRGEELGRLVSCRQLTELNLKCCYALVDAGLSSLGALTSLQILHLNECWQITEIGLSCLKGMTNLRELNLTGCRNIAPPPNGGSIPVFQNFGKVSSLHMRGCDRLRGEALKDMSSMTSLVHLDLSGCRELSGLTLNPLSRLVSLRMLRLQHCMGLHGADALTALEPLTALTYLTLSGCTRIPGAAWRSLSCLKSLKLLYLEGFIMEGNAAAEAISYSCPQLQFVSFQGCSSLTDEGLSALGGLQNLETAILGDCTCLTGSGFDKWATPSLTSLQLQGNTEVSDIGIAHLSRLTSLKDLNLKHCRSIGDAGIQSLSATLTGLRCLSLQGLSNLTDAGAASLSSLKSLSSLDAQFCWQIGDEGAMCLTALTNLTSLDLMYTWKVTDKAMLALAGMKSLLRLNILGCHRVGPQGREAVSRIMVGPKEI